LKPTLQHAKFVYRVVQNRICTPLLTAGVIISLLKVPCIHRMYVWCWPNLQIQHKPLLSVTWLVLCNSWLSSSINVFAAFPCWHASSSQTPLFRPNTAESNDCKIHCGPRPSPPAPACSGQLPVQYLFPSLFCLFNQARLLWPNTPVDVLVSLGCGTVASTQRKRSGLPTAIDIGGVLVDCACSVERVHEALATLLPLVPNVKYYRCVLVVTYVLHCCVLCGACVQSFGHDTALGAKCEVLQVCVS